MWVFKSRVLEKKRRTLVTEKGGGWTDRVICKAARKWSGLRPPAFSSVRSKEQSEMSLPFLACVTWKWRREPCKYYMVIKKEMYMSIYRDRFWWEEQKRIKRYLLCFRTSWVTFVCYDSLHIKFFFFFYAYIKNQSWKCCTQFDWLVLVGETGFHILPN